MLVKNWMSKQVITIDENNSMNEAIGLLKEHNIRMLPVMKRHELVGIITDGDIKRASASDATTLEMHELLYLISQIKVKEIMTKDPITVPQNFTVEETAQILLKNKISCAPVVDDQGQVMGIITQDDLFRVLISLTGASKRGIQLAFQVEDRSGSIKEVTDVIRHYDGRMVSILTSYEDAPAGYRNVYLRVYQINREKLPQLQKELGEKAKMIYMVDHRENKREIYTENY
ncbi:MAG: CBS domain-containing protein [Deltaproteobacteria bacterium]|nr:CBS domain-containing protein [Deltaproteobacteria bacterium]MBW1862926.1 CBS domain-containing protein [Deltaproteobacteria bacterium]